MPSPSITSDAIAAYFRYHADDVERVLIGMVGCDSELPDMVQDVFVRAFNGLGGFRGDASSLRAWIRGIAVRTAYGWIRRRRTRCWVQFPSSEQPDAVAVGDDPEIGHLLSRAARVLERMPIRERLPFELRFIDEMELIEVARACDVSLATAKRRIVRARRRFDRLALHDVLLREWADHPRGRKSSHAESMTAIASAKNAS